MSEPKRAQDCFQQASEKGQKDHSDEHCKAIEKF